MKHIFTKIKNTIIEDATRETKWLAPLSRHLLRFTIAAVFFLISVMCERELNAFEAQAEQYEQLNLYEKVQTAGPATMQEITNYKILMWLSLSIGLLIVIYEILLMAVDVAVAQKGIHIHNKPKQRHTDSYKAGDEKIGEWDKDENIIHGNSVISCEEKPEDAVQENDPELDEILMASKAVSDLCVNEIESKCYFIHHHLPLKDKGKHYLEEENWNLTKEQVSVVKDSLKVLGEYASKICDKYYYGLKKYELYKMKANDKGKILGNKDYHDIVFKDYRPLPPWIVFPHYPVNSLGWRMGMGERYGEVYIRYYSTLSETEQKEEVEKYPYPDYIRITQNIHNN